MPVTFGYEHGINKAKLIYDSNYEMDVQNTMAIERDASNPLQGMGQVKRDGGKLPPIHTWNPPFCGDIDMRIGQDGTWFYMNSPIGRKPLYTLFASVLRLEDDGKYYLVTPVEKCGIIVDDAPFTAIIMMVTGDAKNQVIQFQTNVDDDVVVNADHPLRFVTEKDTGGLKPYVLVRSNLEALVSRSLFYDLVQLAVVECGWFGVWSSGVFFPMQPADDMLLQAPAA